MIFWRAKGTVSFWATRPFGVPFCPAPPRPATPPCVAPIRTARGMFGFWTRHVMMKFKRILARVKMNLVRVNKILIYFRKIREIQLITLRLTQNSLTGISMLL